MKSVLVVLFDKFEELEAVAPIDILRRANFEVCVASLNGTNTVKGRSNIILKTDAIAEQVNVENFDALVVAGGPGVYDNLENDFLIKLVRKFHSGSKLVAAICAAPLILDKAGILTTPAVAYPTAAKLLKNPNMVDRVAYGGNVVTSRGAGTAVDFALKIVEILESKELSKKIAESICF